MDSLVNKADEPGREKFSPLSPTESEVCSLSLDEEIVEQLRVDTDEKKIKKYFLTWRGKYLCLQAKRAVFLLTYTLSCRNMLGNFFGFVRYVVDLDPAGGDVWGEDFFPLGKISYHLRLPLDGMASPALLSAEKIEDCVLVRAEKGKGFSLYLIYPSDSGYCYKIMESCGFDVAVDEGSGVFRGVSFDNLIYGTILTRFDQKGVLFNAYLPFEAESISLKPDDRVIVLCREEEYLISPDLQELKIISHSPTV